MTRLVIIATAIYAGSVAAIVAYGWHMWRQERGIRRSEAQWRAWFADLPEHEKRAGAERLLEAVSETPIHDELAAQVFHAQLADDERIWRKVEGS